MDKKTQKIDYYIIDKKYKYSGYQFWRYFFTGVSKLDGTEATFFIEYYIVNPAVSPKEVLITTKSVVFSSDNDISGEFSASAMASVKDCHPSYVLCKAGRFGENPKHVTSLSPAELFSWNKKDKFIKCGSSYITMDALNGNICVTEEDVLENPELYCNAGSFEWKLRYEKQISCKEFEKTKSDVWYPCGIKTVFAGTITVDGEEYSVIPKKSCGYFEKFWGQSFTSPYYQLSSSKLTSLITGSKLLKSGFSIHGERNGELRFVINVEDQKIDFLKKRTFSKVEEKHDFIEMPGTEENCQKVHWSESFRKGKLIVDIDVYCNTGMMLVKEYECPEGNSKILKILSGGNGTGEMRIYKKTGKNIELLEHVEIENCLCEFGRVEAQ